MAAVLGFGGVVAAALLALLGVLRTSANPSHLADVEGLRVLAEELRAEVTDLRGQLEECRARNRALRAEKGDDDA
jgi:hypothetical protein